ncbi:MAG: WbqC family protein [Flavobacteriales bacterium]|nr:WbqC family protein [Flavobacteriales bacterium]
MILPSSYFSSIFQFALIAQEKKYEIEYYEHFIKQSFRSRCEIYGANGKLSLVVPLQKRRNNTPIQNIKVSYEEKWQHLHWKSIESAYRASPYFEFYEEDLKPLVFLKIESLLERNQVLETEIKSLLGITTEVVQTSLYSPSQPDYREKIHPKNKDLLLAVKFPKYIQVFEEKDGFIPNLSILDLVFNLGPESKSYLQNIHNPF